MSQFENKRVWWFVIFLLAIIYGIYHSMNKDKVDVEIYMMEESIEVNGLD